MKILITLIPVLVIGLLSACSPKSPEGASLSLAPVPYDMQVPVGIAERLTTGPIEGPFGDQVRADGAAAATTVYYQPINGERVIFMTAYYFPADKFDALQAPDQPPLFGSEVLREGGFVLSVAGPLDAIFAPDTPDGRNLEALYGLIQLPSTYRAVEAANR
jgi:hypothetical protein